MVPPWSYRHTRHCAVHGDGFVLVCTWFDRMRMSPKLITKSIYNTGKSPPVNIAPYNKQNEKLINVHPRGCRLVASRHFTIQFYNLYCNRYIFQHRCSEDIPGYAKNNQTILYIFLIFFFLVSCYNLRECTTIWNAENCKLKPRYYIRVRDLLVYRIKRTRFLRCDDKPYSHRCRHSPIQYCDLYLHIISNTRARTRPLMCVKVTATATTINVAIVAE